MTGNPSARHDGPGTGPTGSGSPGLEPGAVCLVRLHRRHEGTLITLRLVPDMPEGPARTVVTFQIEVALEEIRRLVADFSGSTHHAAP